MKAWKKRWKGYEWLSEESRRSHQRSGASPLKLWRMLLHRRSAPFPIQRWLLWHHLHSRIHPDLGRTFTPLEQHTWINVDLKREISPLSSGLRNTCGTFLLHGVECCKEIFTTRNMLTVAPPGESFRRRFSLSFLTIVYKRQIKRKIKTELQM